MANNKLKRIGKKAYKFEYSLVLHSLTLDLNLAKFSPNQVSVAFSRKGKRLYSKLVKWEPSINNPSHGHVVWPEPEKLTSVVTLYKGQKDKTYECKEWEISIIEVNRDGNKKCLGKQAINMSDYIGDALGYSQDLQLRLTPSGRKIKVLTLDCSLHSLFMRVSLSTDTDLHSMSSQMSASALSCISDTEDLDLADLADLESEKPSLYAPPSYVKHEDLLAWSQNCVRGYDGVTIHNFTTSWRNGLGLSAIINHHRPDLLDFESLDPLDITGNNKIAFEAAHSLGVPRLILPELMDQWLVPDRLLVMSLVYQLYIRLEAPDNLPTSRAELSRSHSHTKSEPSRDKEPFSEYQQDSSRKVIELNKPGKVAKQHSPFFGRKAERKQRWAEHERQEQPFIPKEVGRTAIEVTESINIYYINSEFDSKDLFENKLLNKADRELTPKLANKQSEKELGFIGRIKPRDSLEPKLSKKRSKKNLLTHNPLYSTQEPEGFSSSDTFVADSGTAVVHSKLAITHSCKLKDTFCKNDCFTKRDKNSKELAAIHSKTSLPGDSKTAGKKLAHIKSRREKRLRRVPAKNDEHQHSQLLKKYSSVPHMDEMNSDDQFQSSDGARSEANSPISYTQGDNTSEDSEDSSAYSHLLSTQISATEHRLLDAYDARIGPQLVQMRRKSDTLNELSFNEETDYVAHMLKKLCSMQISIDTRHTELKERIVNMACSNGDFLENQLENLDKLVQQKADFDNKFDDLMAITEERDPAKKREMLRRELEHRREMYKSIKSREQLWEEEVLEKEINELARKIREKQA